jgi:hypothetical protein
MARTGLGRVSNTGWKDRERRIARLLGTQRIPVTGERHGADAETEYFAFQIKSRRTVPAYLSAWVDGIRAARPGKVGAVIMQRPHRDDLDALVVITLRDWIDLHGPVYRKGTAEPEVHQG